mmetsp:Transcript_10254/g.22179  ORF Transcript_10254/g.22179 Transcript_10254/m.22179 type:complete len:192 (-) Transcript_10254:240-815(-)|eukprot:CAMPEP_0172525428 /NCGR_PEP_ID=MMETSP1067-20121228/445_1 /TAXON_ID=265564 ORGANISM="Thalassiosira punctigera, Strain Tpunct2005C2" /NCGR_SAMPLE_ID=MMETSP1067 /ASSEMBLY_ACC=CAM_ASM_000444 /LENGTH=191 /DNA_ID=CAMNT_0013308679 /DNA_START=221 /DNA_END=796 /DNA_ORIENTATION=+
MKTYINVPILAIFAVAATTSHAFAPSANTVTITSTSSTHLYAKGFGAPPPEPRKKSAGQTDRDQKASKYDDIAATGGQEYRIFVRKFGSDDQSWLPVGSIAVPRGAQVSDAIFANEEGLRSSIIRTYDKLKGMEIEFEYGYNLKVYPDDPVQVAMKGQSGGSSDGPSFGNWVSNLLSPVDTSGVAPPPVKE